MMHYWKVRLTTYTPTFVGSGEKYKKGQYIYFYKEKEDCTVCFLKEEKWISFLATHGIMDSFASALLADSEHFGFLDFLKKQCGSHKKFKDVWDMLNAMDKAGVIGPDVTCFAKWKKRRLNDIAGHIKDVEGNPYIPGSSLKGAFRTAILSREIRKNRSSYRSVWTKLKSAAGDQDVDAMRDTVNQLEKDFGIPAGEEMAKSYFRGLTASDAVWKKGELCIAAKADLSVDDNETHHVSLYRECLDRNAVLEFTVGIDDSEAGMGHYGIKCFSDLKQVLQEFVDFQYEILQPPFRGNRVLLDIKNHQHADLLLGGGTGFLTKTLLYSLAPDHRAAVEVTRQLLEKQFPGGKHDEYKADILSPHTLKLVSMDGETYLMGLCQLKEEKELC